MWVRPEITQVEVAALLAVAQDHAFGQPPGSQLRATVLGQRLAAAAGADAAERATTWWTSAVRFLGCTGHAFETAVVFGDEIELRAESLRADMADPAVVLRMMISRAGPGLSGLDRVGPIVSVLAGGKKSAELNFRTACEVADAFAIRLGLDAPVRAALAATFERWNGRGLPSGAKGMAIPRPMRIAQISQEFEAVSRAEGFDGALAMIRARRAKGYDPALVDLLLDGATQWRREIERDDPWDAALAVAPAARPLDEAALRESLLVLADFADLKSPWTSGHSRAVAALALDACGPDAEAAALVHDLGRVAVPNTIWDKAGPLTRDERDRAETHALVTDQLLRRVPYMATLAGSAGSAHERLDGSGYHRRVTGGQLDETQRVVAAADCYQAMTSGRPHRQRIDNRAGRARTAGDERVGRARRRGGRARARGGGPSSLGPPAAARGPHRT